MTVLPLDDEIALLARAARGEDDAFAVVVEAYQTPVYNLCYRMLGDPAEAEDAAQEAFWRAYRSLKRFDPGRPFRTWLLSIAAHYCIDQLRRRRLVTFSLEMLRPWEERADPAPGPELEISRREARESVWALLGSLEAKDRAAVILRYWYDMSYEEIADMLSLTVSAVKSRLHRARRSLARSWPVDQEARFVASGG